MKTKIKKLICFTLLISILATALLFVTACDKKTEEQEINYAETPLELGTGSGDVIPPYYVRCKALKSEFNLDDVRITFIYGNVRPHSVPYKIVGPYFISAKDRADSGTEYCLEESDDVIPARETFQREKEYSIPKHLFQYEIGVIKFQVRCVFEGQKDYGNSHYWLVSGYEEDWIYHLGTLELWYKVKGDKVILGSSYAIANLL